MTKQQNPFQMFDADMNKMMADFKMPGMDFDALVAYQRKNLEAVTAANQLAFEGMQAIVSRQTEIIRQMVEEQSQVMQDLMAEGTPEDKLARHADMVKGSYEKALANLKELSEMVSRANNECADVLTSRVSEGLDEVKTTLKNGAAKKK